MIHWTGSSRVRVDGWSSGQHVGSLKPLGGYTYYWSGRSDGARLGGVAIGISSRLQSSMVGVTPVNERIMLLRLKHTLGFMSLMAVYAHTETSVLEEKMFYAKLDYSRSVTLPRHTFSWTTSTR